MLYYLLKFRPMGLVYNDEREFTEFGKITALHRLNHRNKAPTFCMCPGCFHARFQLGYCCTGFDNRLHGLAEQLCSMCKYQNTVEHVRFRSEEHTSELQSRG